MRLRRCRRAPVGFAVSASEAGEFKQTVFNTPSESCKELVFRLGTYLFRESLVSRVRNAFRKSCYLAQN